MWLALLAATVAQLAPPASIRGVVHGPGPDGAAAPIAGARVVLACQPEVPWFESGREVLGEAATDVDGSFACAIPASWLSRASYKAAELFVVAPGYELFATSWQVSELPHDVPLSLSLTPFVVERGARVRVVDPRGEPVSGVTAVVAGVTHPDRGRIDVPLALWRGRGSTTDADGWATLAVPREVLVGVTLLDADGVGATYALGWGAREPFPDTLAFADAAPFSIVIEGPALPTDALVRADLSFANATSPTTTTPLPARHAATGGAMRWNAKAASRSLGLTSRAPEVLEYTATEGTPSGAARFVHGPDLYEVRIPIVDAAGAPLVGVELTVMCGNSLGHARTGQDGVAAFRAAHDMGSVVFVRGPAGFVDLSLPEGLVFQRPARDDGVARVAPFTLPREARIEGRVVGSGSNSVGGALVVGEVEVIHSGFTTTTEVGAIAAADGSFALRGVPEGARCELIGRTLGAEGRAVTVGSATVELILEALVAARGRLVDASGAPIAGAAVEVWSASPEGLIGGERRVALHGREHVVTDADGRFETPPVLRADARYGVRWSGEVVAEGAGDWVTGEALTTAAAYVAKRLGAREGVLRDAAGAPLVGATLRTRRSGAEVTTDAAGHFRLTGLEQDGEVVVVALADGTVRGGVLRPGAEPADWRLERLDAEGTGAPLPPHDRASELALAHELLRGDFEAAVAAGDESMLLRAAERYALADPAAVLHRAEAGLFETAWMRDFTLAYVADALQVESPEEALAVTTRLDRGMSRGLATLDAAAALPRDAELEQLALVRADARTVTPPEHRVVVLARLAERLLELGEDAVARDVLVDAQAVAAGLPSEEWPGYARCVLGEILALVDPAAGIALIDTLQPAGDRGRHYGNIAHRIAAAEPERAEALLAAIDAIPGSSWQSSRWRSRVVHTMAATDLTRAERLASADRTGYCDGMLALALEARDPSTARAALERAFERALALPAAQLDWSEHASAVAALLPVAARLEPTRARAWIERALALPRPTMFGHLSFDERALVADATIAYYVAAWDRAAARALVAPGIAAYRGLDEQAKRSSDLGAVWAAAAAIDPEWAASEARAAGGRAVGLVGQVLARAPAQRDAWVQGELLRLWCPGMEDI